MKSYTDHELKDYAEKVSETIVIRTYDELGNSRDTRRDTTEAEKKVIANIIYGALLAINNGAAKQPAMDTAEYIGILIMDEIVKEGAMNSYDTIYNPIRFFPDYAE